MYEGYAKKGKTKGVTKSKQLPDAFYHLMHQLQMVDFMLDDLQLYLDTHPHDTNAIAQYNEGVKKSRALTKQIERIYGPINEDSYSGAPWQWKDAPWPWQL